MTADETLKLFLLIIALIVVTIDYWLLFVKMDEPGWLSLIPLVNIYIIYKHTMGSGWWMLSAFIPIVGQIVAFIVSCRFFMGFDKGLFISIMATLFLPIGCILLTVCAFDGSYFTENF